MHNLAATFLPDLESVKSSRAARTLEEVAARLCAPFPLELERDFIRYALDCAAIVAITDADGTITYVNSRFCEFSGYSREELIGSNHRMLKSGKHDAAFFRAMYREITKGRVWHGEICNRHKNGSLHWLDVTIVPQVSCRGCGWVSSYTSIRFDITMRKQLEEELQASKVHLQHLAHCDPLTELPNRRGFQRHVAALIAEHTASARRFSLALLDLDGFKAINDSFGHAAGDEILITVASRLRDIPDGRLFISRLGGDEFGLVLADASEAEAVEFFEQVLERIRRPVRIEKILRHCSASLGLAIFPRDGADGESLYKGADLALYHAKSLGRDRSECFRPVLKEIADQRSELLAEIENGLRLEAFELHYQPIVPVASDHGVSLEALMRWRHPERGVLTPAAFQDGFLDLTVRAAFGMFMLEQVFRDMELLRQRGVWFRRVAINLTNSDFRSDSFLDRFFELSRHTGIGPERFCVEVTEGMFLGAGQRHVQYGLQRLHDAGVEVALDDFGTGYASLTHLRQLPIDRLKIDRSFVANMTSSREDQAIIRGIVKIAHSLGKIVTAEGVETTDQVRLLTRMNCDQLQGWFFGKACEIDRLPGLLEQMPRIERAGLRETEARSRIPSGRALRSAAPPPKANLHM